MEHIDWGSVNQPISNEVFDKLHKKMLNHLNGKKLYVVDANCGADNEYSLPIRVVSEAAYHALFARNMFIVPAESAIENHIPQFTVLAAPSFNADPKVDGTR